MARTQPPRPLLAPVLNPQGEDRQLRDLSDRFNRAERAQVRINVNTVQAPQKAPVLAPGTPSVDVGCILDALGTSEPDNDTDTREVANPIGSEVVCAMVIGGLSEGYTISGDEPWAEITGVANVGYWWVRLPIAGDTITWVSPDEANTITQYYMAVSPALSDEEIVAAIIDCLNLDE